MSSNAVFKGDDTGAFGNQFLKITVKNPLLYPISKILFIVNSGTCIPPKEFTDENNFQTAEITLTANFSSQETAKLNATNTGNLVAYDMNGLQYTCPQTLIFYAQNGVITLTFYAQNGVITKNGQSCY